MIHGGLVSITFRSLSPRAIVGLVSRAGLQGIEWGGDVHVPHGDLDRAREVRQLTLDAGLQVAAYGSYYRVGCAEKTSGLYFPRVLESAVALGAPVIRVWAGDRGSAVSDAAWRETVAMDARRIEHMAREAGIGVAFEYHGGTLTDTGESARQWMQAVGAAGLTCYWQPPVGLEDELRVEGLRQILPWLGNFHVFFWKTGVDAQSPPDRRPLAEGIESWSRYLSVIRQAPAAHRYGLIEFVRNEDPDQFLQDAAVLHSILEDL